MEDKLKELFNDIEQLLKEAEEHSNNSARGYDEGWYNGECNAYKIVLEKVKDTIRKNRIRELLK